MTTAVKGHFSCPPAVFTKLWEDWRLADRLSLSQSYTPSSPGSRAGFSFDQQVVNNNLLPEEKRSWWHSRFFDIFIIFSVPGFHFFQEWSYVFIWALTFDQMPLTGGLLCCCVIESFQLRWTLLTAPCSDWNKWTATITQWPFCNLGVCATVRHCSALAASPLPVCLPLTLSII